MAAVGNCLSDMVASGPLLARQRLEAATRFAEMEDVSVRSSRTVLSKCRQDLSALGLCKAPLSHFLAHGHHRFRPFTFFELARFREDDAALER